MAKKKDDSAHKFDLDVQGSPKELGQLQYTVLTSVASGDYPDALKTLGDYRKYKASYPLFKGKTDRIFEHCDELVDAIKAKKTFPNLSNLAQSKQEEIHQKARENWEDLRVSLRRIRTIESELALADARSSIWVIRTAILCFIVVMLVFFVNEAFRSFGKSFPVFLDEAVKGVWALFD